ncbi:MAG: T9SS type A sorting domain-containing protein, partial [Candidatus Krumholzibacteria bacterium]|nr:T9SS type A sorting domain-containing protein [Candidatus Krumholzibacteria bacterium]
LSQNYPNPFNPATTIAFYLPEQADVSLSVYDVSGRLVRELESGALGAGWHSAAWDGTAASGKAAGSGAYFCRLKAGKEIITRKMILLR